VRGPSFDRRGLLNKQAASVLGISEVTLQIHRSQVMRKMRADSMADLVRMASKLRIPFWREGQGALAVPAEVIDLHSPKQQAFWFFFGGCVPKRRPNKGRDCSRPHL